MAEIYSEYDGNYLTPEQIAELDAALRAELGEWAELAEMDADLEPEPEAEI